MKTAKSVFTSAQLVEMAREKAGGRSYASIGKTFKVHETTILRVLRRAGGFESVLADEYARVKAAEAAEAAAKAKPAKTAKNKTAAKKSGESKFAPKITESQAVELRKLRAAGWSYSKLGERYGMSTSGASYVARGNCFPNAGGPLASSGPAARPAKPPKVDDAKYAPSVAF